MADAGVPEIPRDGWKFVRAFDWDEGTWWHFRRGKFDGVVVGGQGRWEARLGTTNARVTPLGVERAAGGWREFTRLSDAKAWLERMSRAGFLMRAALRARDVVEDVFNRRNKGPSREIWS